MLNFVINFWQLTLLFYYFKDKKLLSLNLREQYLQAVK